MSTIVYERAVAPTADGVAAAGAAKPRRGFWRHVLDTLAAAQMARAEAEIRRHCVLMGEDWAAPAWTRAPLSADETRRQGR